MGFAGAWGAGGEHEGDRHVQSLDGGEAVLRAKRSEGVEVDGQEASRSRPARHHRQRPVTRLKTSTTICALLAGSLHTAMAQNECISLGDSAACPAFNAASISTNNNLTGLFPFLSSVTDVASFDSELQSYIDGAFASLRCVSSLESS